MNFVAMTPDKTKELNRIAERYRKPYTEFIDELSEIYGDSEFWWDTPLASRNTFLCACFLNVCTLRLVLDGVSRNAPKELVVANEALRQAVLENVTGIAVHVGNHPKGIKAFLKQSHRIRSEYAFYQFRKHIQASQRYRRNESLAEFQGREIILVGTYRVPAEARNGMFQDRYFSGLTENSDKDIVFLSMFSGVQDTEKTLFDVIHDRNDHICIEDWVAEQDLREIRSYIRWCRSIKIQPCCFDGMDITALVENALQAGGWDGNAMLGIARGNALCRIVEQWGLKIKCLMDWYEGQPSSNAMIRRFRKKFPDVPTVACAPFPYEENLLSLYPSARQVAGKVVPAYFSVMGQVWKKQVRQFSNDVKCVVGPSLRHNGIWETAAKESSERKGVLLVLPIFEDCSAQLLTAFGEAIQGLDISKIGPIYIKSHPVNQGHRISDYGVSEAMFYGGDITYLSGNINEALRGKKMVVLTETTSTLEVMLSGAYTINFIPAGELSAVCVPEEVRSKIAIAYTAQDLRAFLKSPQKGLSPEEVEQLREKAFTRVNRETVADFLALRPV